MMKLAVSSRDTRPCAENHSDRLAAIAALVAVLLAPSADGQDKYGRNYDESKVGRYTVPNPLVANNGDPVTDAESWLNTRRGEIQQDFRDLMYGHTPELPLWPRSTIVSTRADSIDGLARRTILRLQFFDDPEAPQIRLMVYLPNNVAEPAPTFLGLDISGNASVEKDPTIPLPTSWMRPKEDVVVNNRATESLRGVSASRWPIRMAIERGYGSRNLLLRRCRAGSHRWLAGWYSRLCVEALRQERTRSRRLGRTRCLGVGPQPSHGLP